MWRGHGVILSNKENGTVVVVNGSHSPLKVFKVRPWVGSIKF